MQMVNDITLKDALCYYYQAYNITLYIHKALAQTIFMQQNGIYATTKLGSKHNLIKWHMKGYIHIIYMLTLSCVLHILTDDDNNNDNGYL